MTVNYTVSLADFRAGLRLHYRQKLSRRVTHVISLWLMPFVMLLFIIPSAYTMIADPESYSGGLGFLILAFLLSLSLPLSRYFVVGKQFKNTFPNSKTGEELSIDIDDERIISTVPGTGEGKYYWTAILEFAQDEKATLLYTRKNMFLLIPTQVMTSAQRTELNELVARNMPRKQK